MFAVRWICSLVVLIASLALPSGDAGADGGAGTICAYGVCTVSGDAGHSGGGKRSGGTSTCLWQAKTVPCTSEGKVFVPTSGCYQGPPDVSPTDGPVLAQVKAYGGAIVFATCPFGGSGGYIWQPPAKPVVTPALVRQQAVRFVPSAAVGVAPKGTTLVNIETVLWADAPTRLNLPTVTLLGQRVVITLGLNRVNWTFGDGQTDDNAPAGKAYDGRNHPCRHKLCPDYYGHVYARTGKVEITATAYWHATFTVDGSPQREAGNVPGPRATANVTVKQARAVLVPNPGQSP